MDGVVMYTDGGARGNPGPAGAGAVIWKGDSKVGEVKKFLGERQTNNWAEYEAVALGLAEAAHLGYTGEIEIRMDSKLVVEQMMGNWKIKEETLKPQALKVRQLLAKDFPKYRFVYVPRAQNADADALVNEAIDSAGF